jgi:hypothetical protein
VTEIVVSHLTRMTYPRLCVAGISEEAKTHVRPVTAKTDLITRSLLAEEGGPLRLGARIGLGETTAVPNPPECEDHWCETADFAELGRLGDEEYLGLLEEVAAADLAAAFGPELERHGRSYAIERGVGTCSLVCLAASGDERLVMSYGQPRLRDGDGALVRVTDLRFFEPDQKTPRVDLVADVNRRLEDGVPAFLMYGLARAWKKPDDDRSRHWLQLNGICLADRPSGDVP